MAADGLALFACAGRDLFEAVEAVGAVRGSGDRRGTAGTSFSSRAWSMSTRQRWSQSSTQTPRDCSSRGGAYCGKSEAPIRTPSTSAPAR